jgi:FkbM family methyltransferase
MKRGDLVGLALRLAPHRGRLVMRILGWWQRRLRPGDVRQRRLPGGVRIEVRMEFPYERDIWLHPEQLADVKYASRLLGTGDVFVDCGANVGLWTLPACRAVGDRGGVISIEPNPDVFARLRRNVDLNGFADRCNLVRHAVGDRNGDATFDPGGNFHNIGRIVQAGSGIHVEVRTLDSIVGTRTIKGVKIDIEGGELEALRGGGTVLERDRPWVIVEYGPSELPDSPFDKWPVHRWLVRRGWEARSLLRSEPRVPPGWTPDPGESHLNLLYRHS